MCVHVCVQVVCVYVCHMYVCACVYMYVCACMCVHVCVCMWVGESPTEHVYDAVRLNKYLTILSCKNVLLLLLGKQSTHTCLESSCSIW